MCNKESGRVVENNETGKKRVIAKYNIIEANEEVEKRDPRIFSHRLVPLPVEENICVNAGSTCGQRNII